MLEGLYAGAIADADQRQRDLPTSAVEKLAIQTAPALDAIDFLKPAKHIKVLAEVKRASPSKGNLAEIADPAELAFTYAQSGASTISVLTEQHRFKGSLTDLRAVRARVNIPVLRKDFIANEYQVLEARAAGADLVLLIVAGLEGRRLIRLKNLIEELGMTAFVETHNSDEVKFAVDINTRLLGVNARDLSTFETDRNLFGSLRDLIPNETIKVAESAVRNVADVRHYREAGADVVLVGEALVTGNPAELLKEFTAI
ncbi:MAG: indole-3-glycerol phosphate synthase TrpC [Micrococcales bacterium]